MLPHRLCWIIGVTILAAVQTGAQAAYRQIIVPEKSHPAIRSAAEIMAKNLGLPKDAVKTAAEPAMPASGDIVLAVAPGTPAQIQLLGDKAKSIKYDGYMMAFRDGGALVYGNFPRSLLFAAGDWRLWKDKTRGTLVREPAFAIRTGSYDPNRTVAEFVAELGVNAVIGKPNDAVVRLKQTLPEVYQQFDPQEQTRLDARRAARAKVTQAFTGQCHDADVQTYFFLYGNDFTLWSSGLYQAAVKAFPSIKGTPATQSWEKAWLCPSDPQTWKLVRAYLQEVMDQTGADGVYATFWDRFGIHCQDERCKQNGLDKFPNELYECVKQYREALQPAGKKLVVRTWSSGVPHWLNDEFVHAPGYGHFGGTHEALWSRVIKDLPSDVIIQTKVYNADCAPDPPFTPLLGKAKPHTEIAEYQLSGQTIGRYYFPASTVDYDTWTMRKSHELVGGEGGVSVYPGGTQQGNEYSVFDDILNSINLYAWREVAWDVNADLGKVWMDWAVPIYGEKAAPHVVKALRLSEEAVYRSFSTLGMGSDTNSGFAGNIARRETLLMYTNRYYLPEGQKNLEPTKENIRRVAEEKAACLRTIDEMIAELEKAKPDLKPEQAAELATRFDWLKEDATCRALLDESLWRYRYLRHLSNMLTTDPEQLKSLAEAYDAVKEHEKRLFAYSPDQKFSCYDVPLGELKIKPTLGQPTSLMKELYVKSKELVEGIVGPNYVPAEWKR